MHLTKLELQEMLREMGVKFSHRESYENLKKLFQEENHMRWMGKVSTNDQRSSSGFKRVIRKRAAAGSQKMMVLSKPPAVIKNDEMPKAATDSKHIRQEIHREKSRRAKPYSRTNLPGARGATRKESKEIFDRSKDIFTTVLRRAQRCCELCGQKNDTSQLLSDHLKPYYIQPLDQGGEISIKNIVALCKDCHRRLATDALPSDLKQLKRKARGKIIRSVQIERKSRS